MLRIGLICDFAEEGWPSMDLVGDMLFENLNRRYADSLRSDRMRPAFRRRATAMSLTRGSHAAWNADRLWNRMVEYPRWLRRKASDYDVFHIVDHSYAHLALELPPERTVITCHDLDAFRCLVEPKRDSRPLWFRKMTQRILSGLQGAAHVVFVSDTVRREAAQFGLIRAERASVIHNGVITGEGSAAAEAEADRLLRPLLDPSMDGESFLLSVGSTVARKRIDVLLRTFAGVAAAFPGMKLVRVGGPFTEPQAALARELGIDRLIVSMPFLEREVLTAIYRRAALLLQTSEAEGFGLPLAEAMAVGCPVVASDLAVLREVGGDAASYCPVGDVAAWTGRVTDLLRRREAEPAPWRELTARSIRNAGRFSWGDASDQLVGLYRQVLREGRKGRAPNGRSTAIGEDPGASVL